MNFVYQYFLLIKKKKNILDILPIHTSSFEIYLFGYIYEFAVCLNNVLFQNFKYF